jgi:chromosome segregation ATPase
MADTPDIPFRVLLDHIQAIGNELRTDIRALRTDIANVHVRIDRLDQKLSDRIDTVEARLTWKIGALDKRLDDIEIKELPKRIASNSRRITRIEKHLALR